MELEKKSCCSSAEPKNVASDQTETTDLQAEIRRRYAELARSQGGSCCGASSKMLETGGESCCDPTRETGGTGSESCCGTISLSLNAGYTEEELRSLPERAAAASAGCGNPTALAGLNDGETVLDLGSGGGIDVFLAAQKVGPKGRVIGVDMTPEMIDLARQNAARAGLENVEFRLGEIEHLPVADESVDVIISNCVINLSTNKEAVFGEAYRVLRRGGRMIVSDIMADGLPDEVKGDFSSWARCVGGAIPLNEYTGKIRDAGFADIDVLNESSYTPELVRESMLATGAVSSSGKPELPKPAKSIRVSHAEIQAKKI